MSINTEQSLGTQFQAASGSVTYWRTLSKQMLEVIFNPYVASKVLLDYAPGEENIVWLQKHPENDYGLGIVAPKGAANFRVLVCREGDSQTFGEIYDRYNAFLKQANALEGLDPGGFSDILELISNKLCEYVRLGTVKDCSISGNKTPRSLNQFIEDIYPAESAMYRLRSFVPTTEAGGTPGLAKVALELESRNFKDNSNQNASDESNESWNSIKAQEAGAKLDTVFSASTTRIAQFYGRRMS